MYRLERFFIVFIFKFWFLGIVSSNEEITIRSILVNVEPDEDFSRNTLCAKKLIYTFLLKNNHSFSYKMHWCCSSLRKCCTRNILRKISLLFLEQLIRYARASSNYSDFLKRPFFTFTRSPKWYIFSTKIK
jgi:hypothetical protein